MTGLDLANTFLSLDGQGQIRTHPAAGFWETVDTNAALLGTIVTTFESQQDWAHWEMHPEGEEVLILLDGRMTLILDEPDGERRVEMATDSIHIVPRGVWHRALVPGPCRLLGITYGAGTTHRPI